MNKYVVVSGWWCDSVESKDNREQLFGDNLIREKDFFLAWYKAINSYTTPEKILVVDSNSPVKPDLPDDSRLEFLSLDINAGHSTNHVGDWCGYTRAALLGLAYAMTCDVDYVVYIEQDCLISGKGIIDAAISNMRGDVSFGSGEGTPGALQQSFFVMKKDFIPKFIFNYSKIKERDNLISPEVKFSICSYQFLSYIPSNFLPRTKQGKGILSLIRRLVFRLIKLIVDKHALPFGYGRSRPVNFEDRFYYFQHGSKLELKEYHNKNRSKNENL